MRIKKNRKRIKYLKFILLILGLGILSTSLSFGYFYIISLELEQNNPIKVKGTFIAPTTIEEYKKSLAKNRIIFEKISFFDDGSAIQFQIKEGPVVYFSTSKNLKDQISSLQAILTHPTIDSKKPSKIDFRFEKIVVNF